jgi:hypothetical protein
MNCRSAEIKAGLSADKEKDGPGVWIRLSNGECLDIDDVD